MGARPVLARSKPLSLHWYEYVLYNEFHRKVKLQARGPRKLLSFNFSLAGGGQTRLDLHKVFAYNCTSYCNALFLLKSPLAPAQARAQEGTGARVCYVRRLPWHDESHSHHHPFPKRQPWTNCTKQNLLVMSRAAHERWHRLNPRVAR